MIQCYRFTDFLADEARTAHVRKPKTRHEALPRSTDMVGDASSVADRQILNVRK